MSKQQYWLGPGVYGSKAQKNLLKPGDPLPDNFSKADMKRFAKKIGEKFERGVINNIEQLKKENAELKKENAELKKELGMDSDKKPEGDENDNT